MVDSEFSSGDDLAVRPPGFLRTHLLTILTIICAISGFAVGQAIRHAGLSDTVGRYVDIPGQMIMHSYTMLLVPILFCGIILGIASLRQSGSDRLVILTAVFFILMMSGTSLFSCVLAKQLGIGHHVINMPDDYNLTSPDDSETVINSIIDFFENAVPDNIISATFIQKETVSKMINISLPDGNDTLVVERVIVYKYQTNYAGLLMFCLIFGGAMSILGNKVQTLYLVLDEINLTIMMILQYSVKILPIGLFFWLCCQGMVTESIGDTFARMGFYLSIFISFQLGYHFLVLPLLYLIIVQKNPFKFMVSLCPVVLMAFGSSSSSACLPLTLQLMEENLKCHPFVTRFVLPLGSLINKQGATLATPLTVFFIAGLQGVKIGIVKTIVLGISNVLLQMAFPGIPGNGMTTLWFLYFVGVVKPYVIGLVLSVEWFLDRLITVNNVVANCYVTAYLDKLCASSLAGLPTGAQAVNSFVIGRGSLTSFRSNSLPTASYDSSANRLSIY